MDNTIFEILSVVSKIIKDIQYFEFFINTSKPLFRMDANTLQIGQKQIPTNVINRSKRTIETSLEDVLKNEKASAEYGTFRLVCDMNNNEFGKYIKYITSSKEGDAQLKSLFEISKNGSAVSLSVSYKNYEENKDIINIILGQ